MSEGEKLFHPVTASLAAIFLMLLATGLVSHTNRYHHHQDGSPSEAPTLADDRNALSLGPAVNGDGVGHAEQKNAGGNYSNNRFWWGDTFAQWVMATTGIGALIASVFSVWLVVWTFREQRKLTQIESRAFLGIKNVRLTEFDMGKAVWAEVTVLNAGQTAAQNVRIWMNVEVHRRDDVDILPPLQATPDSCVYISQHSAVKVRKSWGVAPDYLNAEIKKAFGSGMWGISVYGKISYFDGFSNHERKTKFRYYIGGRAGWRPGDPDDLRQYPTGNEAD